MLPIDRQFQKVSKRRGMKYSRWIDDFIISSPKDRDSESFLSLLYIMNGDFRIKPEKVAYQKNPAYFMGYKVDGKSLENISKEQGKSITQSVNIPPEILALYLSPREYDNLDLEPFDPAAF